MSRVNEQLLPQLKLCDRKRALSLAFSALATLCAQALSHENVIQKSKYTGGKDGGDGGHLSLCSFVLSSFSHVFAALIVQTGIKPSSPNMGS